METVVTRATALKTSTRVLHAKLVSALQLYFSIDLTSNLVVHLNCQRNNIAISVCLTFL